MLNKKILTGVIGGALLTAAISASAATSGAYVGGQLGYGNVHQNDDHLRGISENHFAGRLLGGYQFTDNLAVELGLAKFGNLNYKYSYGNAVETISAHGTLQTYVVDLALKGIVPVADKVSLYGKVGGAYVRETLKGSADATIFGMPGHSSFTQKASKLLPEAGVGVSYALNDNVSADLFYTRIQKVGNNTLVNSIDFAGVGLTYNFG